MIELLLYRELKNISNDSENNSLFENSFHQIDIYNEMRRHNKVESYRHVFGVMGALISIFGIFGKFKFKISILFYYCKCFLISACFLNASTFLYIE